MSLTLHFHPLSSFCHKVLIALYENDTPFTPKLVDLGDAAQRAAFRAFWPVGKFPVLRDDGARRDGAGVEHHHRVSRPALSGQHAVHSGGRRASARRCAFATASSICYIHLHDAEDRRRPPAARRTPRTRMAWRTRARAWRWRSASSRRRWRAAMSSSSLGRPARASRWPTARPRRRCSMPTRSRRSPAPIPTSSPISTG